MNIFDHYRQRYEAAKDEEFTLQDFLTICRQDRIAILRLKSFTAWKTRLNRLSLI